MLNVGPAPAAFSPFPRKALQKALRGAAPPFTKQHWRWPMARFIRLDEEQFRDLIKHRVLSLPDHDVELALTELSLTQLLRAVHHAMPLEHLSLGDRCVVLAAERERLMYWVLRLLQESRAATVLGAMRCLADMRCSPTSEQARNLLSLGEPGLHLSDKP